jgi:hypothetical protein
MIGVPITALDEERPARFGWHMYAALESQPEITVTFEDGTIESVPFESIAAEPKVEPDYAEPIAKLMCTTRPRATTVRVSRAQPAYERRFECSSF